MEVILIFLHKPSPGNWFQDNSQCAKNEAYHTENEDHDGDQIYYDVDQRYRIGDDHITPNDIILIGTVQVSQGSWMPILQLNNGYVQCLGVEWSKARFAASREFFRQYTTQSLSVQIQHSTILYYTILY